MSSEVENLETGKIRPGEVRNPEGRNQYSYKRDFEVTIDKLLAGELTETEAELVPEAAKALIKPGMSRGEALAVVTVTAALCGDDKHLAELLKRVWPITSKHELSGPDGGAIVQSQVPDGMENLSDEDRALARALGRKALGLAAPAIEDSE